MEQELFTNTVTKVKQDSPERNFDQTVELVINLRDMDMNDPDNKIDFFISAPNDMGMDRKICALVGPELEDAAADVCDKVIKHDDFDSFEPREFKKIAQNYDFFVAQATIMPDVASAFGRYLGPRGKMPSPKAGSVVPPNANLKPLYEKLQKTLAITAKKGPVVHTVLGKEDIDDDKLGDNAMFIYNQLLRRLPQEQNNIKEMYVKLTMGQPVKVE
jgi:large subunit ribosomal protein L1